MLRKLTKSLTPRKREQPGQQQRRHERGRRSERGREGVLHRLYRGLQRWGRRKRRRGEKSGEGTFKRLLILPGHCCCHQVGHVTELCILKERERTTEGGAAGQKQLKTFRSTAACPFSSCTSFEFRAHPIPIDDGSSFPYGERAFQIQRFSATTDHISAPTILSQQVCQEGGGRRDLCWYRNECHIRRWKRERDWRSRFLADKLLQGAS